MWTIQGSNPFGELKSLQREMNRLFNNYNDTGASFPPVNIYGNEERLSVVAELPGVAKENINISVESDIITIEGERKSPEINENETFHRREREYGKFVRSFRLPYEVDNEKVEASLKDGVLTVTLPRAEQSKPKKISINC